LRLQDLIRDDVGKILHNVETMTTLHAVSPGGSQEPAARFLREVDGFHAADCPFRLKTD